MSWNASLAKIWTKMVGPSRPTISELNIYTKYIRFLMKNKKRRLKVLILGSTPEFRDWAFEENMIVTVMDANPDYFSTINREIRHKTIVDNNLEKVIYCRWEDMDPSNKFDVIIGDLVTGNIIPNRLDSFLKKISESLEDDGLYLGKSFYFPDGYKVKTPEKLVKDYYDKGIPYHPYSSFAFDLTMYCVDENNMLDFSKQFNELVKLKNNGLLKEETFNYFVGVGWDSEMKFKFYVPKVSYYEERIRAYLKIINIEYASEVYSKNFPLHIVTTKNSKIYGGLK